MAQNPVLYAIQNLQSGRSSGTFRGVKQQVELNSNIPTLAALTQQFNTDMAADAETAPARKTVYDTAVANLTAQFPALQAQRAAAQAANAGNYKQLNYYTIAASKDTSDRGFYEQSRNYYQAQIDAAMAPYDSQLSALNKAKTDAWEAYAGNPTRLKTAYETKRAELTADGLLAQAKVDPEAVAPDVSTGSTLAATDLYSDDLQSQIAGKQQTLQATADVPEDDIVTGALQSSIYSKR